MNFASAARTGLAKYFSFSGRATRPEYWWFLLFVLLGSLVFTLLDGLLFGADAVTYFCARIAREIAALAADMGGIDALVFTGGIGENAAPIRAQICASLDWLGLALQPEKNNGAPGLISPTGAARPVLAIPTNEELIIARAASRLIGGPEGV